MITLKQLAMYILSLPEEQQEMQAYVDDDARLLPLVREHPIQRMFRDSTGYKHSLDPNEPQFFHHYSEEERTTLTEVMVLSGDV